MNFFFIFWLLSSIELLILDFVRLYDEFFKSIQEILFFGGRRRYYFRLLFKTKKINSDCLGYETPLLIGFLFLCAHVYYLSQLPLPKTIVMCFCENVNMLEEEKNPVVYASASTQSTNDEINNVINNVDINYVKFKEEPIAKEETEIIRNVHNLGGGVNLFSKNSEICTIWQKDNFYLSSSKQKCIDCFGVYFFNLGKLVGFAFCGIFHIRYLEIRHKTFVLSFAHLQYLILCGSKFNFFKKCTPPFFLCHFFTYFCWFFFLKKVDEKNVCRMNFRPHVGHL